LLQQWPPELAQKWHTLLQSLAERSTRQLERLRSLSRERELWLRSATAQRHVVRYAEGENHGY
ncbi:MAG: hypothetical protein ABDH31_06500, partial [Chlorobiota bacterium]